MRRTLRRLARALGLGRLVPPMSPRSQIIALIMSLRQQGVTQEAVLSAIEKVPRDVFVPEIFADQAYDNTALPIACGQAISQPLIVGHMTQALEIGDRHRVLEIGTGSGYQAAVLAHLARRVYTVERYGSLLAEAERRFQVLSLFNITTRHGDGMDGWEEQAPFDRIIVTAAAERVPAALARQLSVNGLMIIPIDRGRSHQTLVRVQHGARGLESTDLMNVRFVPLLSGHVP